MSKYLELAQYMSDKGMSDIDTQLQELKAQKEFTNESINQQISQLKIIKGQQKAESQRIKAEQKKQQINKELIKMMVDSGEAGPMAVGGQMVDQFAGVETEPEATGLPILNGIA